MAGYLNNGRSIATQPPSCCYEVGTKWAPRWISRLQRLRKNGV